MQKRAVAFVLPVGADGLSAPIKSYFFITRKEGEKRVKGW